MRTRPATRHDGASTWRAHDVQRAGQAVHPATVEPTPAPAHTPRIEPGERRAALIEMSLRWQREHQGR